MYVDRSLHPYIWHKQHICDVRLLHMSAVSVDGLLHYHEHQQHHSNCILLSCRYYGLPDYLDTLLDWSLSYCHLCTATKVREGRKHLWSPQLQRKTLLQTARYLPPGLRVFRPTRTQHNKANKKRDLRNSRGNSSNISFYVFLFFPSPAPFKKQGGWSDRCSLSSRSLLRRSC